MTYPPQQPDPNQPAQPQWPPTQQLPAGGYQPGQPPQWRPPQQMPAGYSPPGQQLPPQWPSASGPATQAAALQHAIALSSARGWRLEGTSQGVATMVSGHKPNHVLHLLLTLFTCGLWAIAWIVIAVTVTEKRLTIVSDLNGNIAYPSGPYPPPSVPRPESAYPQPPGQHPEGAFSPPQQRNRPVVTTGGWVAIGAGSLVAVVLLAVAVSGGFSSSTQLPDQSRNNNRIVDQPAPSDATPSDATSSPTTPTTPVTPAQPAPPPSTAPSDDEVLKAVLGYQACPGKQHDTLNNVLSAVFVIAHDDAQGSRMIERTSNHARLGVGYLEGGQKKEAVFNYGFSTHEVTGADSLAINVLETLKLECG